MGGRANQVIRYEHPAEGFLYQSFRDETCHATHTNLKGNN